MNPPRSKEEVGKEKKNDRGDGINGEGWIEKRGAMGKRKSRKKWNEKVLSLPRIRSKKYGFWRVRLQFFSIVFSFSWESDLLKGGEGVHSRRTSLF